MPLTAHLCHLVASALLFLLCSTTSCLAINCVSHTSPCGSIEIAYPFGENGSGCGDPEFQVHSCDSDNHPLIHIGGNEYHILESSFLANSSISKILTIVNDNLWGGRCNFSGNYSQFWWPASNFQILDTYTNLTLWKHCDDQIPGNISGTLSLCGNHWYYSLGPHLNSEGTTFCNAFQLPIKKNLYTQSMGNQTLLGQGFEITWHVDPNRDESCAVCLKGNGICGYDILKPTTFVCYCPDGSTHPDKCPANGTAYTGGRNMPPIIISCSVVTVVVMAAISLLFLFRFYSKRKRPAGPGRIATSKVEKFLKEYAYEMPTRYSYSYLKKITNNFAERLGAGGYGVVYKGKLRNGALVAVKIVDRHRHSEAQFMNEVATIGRVHHVNLVRLLGYCFETPTSALVYEFMVNGSLDKFIFAGKEKEGVLRWEQLYSIALGTARGIAYLHQDCEKRIIHFDIKPHNILLGAEFTPKVSDFGLAKLCGKGEDHVSMTGWKGTPGYVAPEVCYRDMGPVTDKSDVYSFGMLLIEMVGGRKNTNWEGSCPSQLYFPDWAFQLLESGDLGTRLKGDMEAEEEEKTRRLIKVGLWCIQYNSADRPCMNKVVQMLKGNGDDVTNPPLPLHPWIVS